MKGILEVFPQPKWVKIGGRPLLAGQFRLCDLAALQSYLEDRLPHPLEAARNDLRTLEGKERRRRLATLQREAQTYGPSVLKDAAFVLADTESVAVWLTLLLARFNQVASKEFVKLADDLAFEEYVVLDKIAYGVTSAAELHNLCFPDRITDSVEPDWREMVDHLATSKHWTYQEIGELTLSQFKVALCEGETKTRNNVTGLSQSQLLELVKKQREEDGLDDEKEVQ